VPRVLGAGGDLAGLRLLHRGCRQTGPSGPPADEPSEARASAGQVRRIDLDQLRGFVYVGAAALALLAAAVILLGLFSNRSGRAEGLAVLGFFGYAAYLATATLVLYVMSRKN
jgi:hypothetical protein